jgi:hypothetical protein
MSRKGAALRRRVPRNALAWASLADPRADAIEISGVSGAVTPVAVTTCVWTWLGWYDC